MNARSALFDLYGDHLRSRGGRAPVAALVRLLGALDIAAPAVRTAVSRMVRQGWLSPVRTPHGPGYDLTPRAVSRLDAAAVRIYRTGTADWDGAWHVAVLAPVTDRTARERLRTAMAYFGYAPLDDNTWVAPRPSAEVDAFLVGERVRADRFRASYEGDSLALVARAWDLEGIARAYRRWLDDANALLDAAGPDPRDAVAFATRSRLVHEWRKFLFRDPGLPRVLLPPDWPGDKAAESFDSAAERLAPAASRYVDHCLEAPRV